MGHGAGRGILHWEVEDNEKRSVGIGLVSVFALFNHKAVCIKLSNNNSKNNSACFCSSMTKKKPY